MIRLLLLLLLLALTGCSLAAHPRLLRIDATEAGSSKWIKVESPGFTLVTDLSVSNAQEAAHEVAAELPAIAAAFGNATPRFDYAVEIVVYSDGLDFEARFGRWRAVATHLDLEAKRFAIHIWGKPDRWIAHPMEGLTSARGSLMRQALAEAVLVRSIPARTLARWFVHGMGSYISTMEWASDGKSIQLGAANSSAMHDYANARSVGFTDVTGPRREHIAQQEAYERGYEAYCWALMFTAVHEEAQGLNAYFEAIARGEAPEPSSLFEGLTPEAIDREVDQFVRVGVPVLHKVEVPPSPVVEAKLSPMTDEEAAKYVPPPQPQPWE